MIKSLPSTLLGLFCIYAAINQSFGLKCYQCTENASSERPCTQAASGGWNETENCDEDKKACSRWITDFAGIVYGCDGGVHKGRCLQNGNKYLCDEDLCNTKATAESAGCSPEDAKGKEKEKMAQTTTEGNDKVTDKPGNTTGDSGATDKSSSWSSLACIVVLTIAGFRQIRGGGVII